jgi:replicative DNA helicase
MTDIKTIENVEQQIIKLIVTDVLAASIGIAKLNSFNFRDYRAAELFELINKLFIENGKINVPLIQSKTKKKELLSYLTSAIDTSITADIDSLCSIVIDTFVSTELAGFCDNTLSSLRTKYISGTDLLNSFQTKVLELSNFGRKGFHSFEKSLIKTRELINSLTENSAEILGLETGVTELDRKTTGFKGPQLIVIGGRPSHGKSEFILSSLVNMAFNQKKECALFSLEMSIDEINMRIISNITQIPLWKIRTGNLTTADHSKLDWLSDRSKDINIHISDETVLTPSALHAIVKRLKIEKPNLAIIGIDYLQLMQSDSRGENRNLEISEITRGLKLLAKDVDIPIILASQMARRVEERKSKKPKLSDLRDSGAIEADADIVIFCQKPDNAFKEGSDQYVMKLVLEKQRMGTTGTILATNDASTQRIFQTGTELIDEREWEDEELPY